MLRHGILGLLNYRDMTGYEMMMIFRDLLSHFWIAQTSQIYRELQTLEKQEMVSVKHVRQDGKPDKNIFTITQIGKEELGKWLVEDTASLVFVAALFLAHVGNIERIMFWAFIIGNILYYAVGIGLAYAFKDNRAFCKYICPITVFLKPMSYFSLVRIKCDESKCISCGKCKRVCPMNVDVTDNSRKRENGTECILCTECVRNCPKDAL